MNEKNEMNDRPTPGVVESTGSRFYALPVSWGVPGVIAAAIIGFRNHQRMPTHHKSAKKTSPNVLWRSGLKSG